MPQIENGKISNTFLGIEDHGIMSFMIDITFDGSGQGFGGYAMDSYNKDTGGRRGSEFGIEAIRKILEVVDVDSWEKLKGQHIRVKRNEGPFGKIDAIGHIVNDRWYDIAEHARSKK